MAKISARGDREIARWDDGAGRVLVHTERGRLLYRLTKTSAYNVVGTRVSAQAAHEFAESRGLVPA